MNFDPIYDYGNSDLSNDDNLVCWKFCELIKNLITLSSSAVRQQEIIGIGATCDEMAIDFDTYFTLAYKSYFNKGLLTLEQIEMLKELNLYFGERGGGKSPDFWDDWLLDANPEWQWVRDKSNLVLESLGVQDLTIEVFHELKYVMTDKGRHISGQATQTRLVKQNDNTLGLG